MFSTDFVFDGTKKTPYLESDSTNPTEFLWTTKLDGEKQFKKHLDYFIVNLMCTCSLPIIS
jgi:dTDP-4-dehydrorhamnose reductase